MLNDEELFGSPENCVITCCKEEFDEVFGESVFTSER